MSKKIRLLLVSLGAVVLVGVLGIGAAFAADPTATPTTAADYQKVFVSKLASALGITDEQKVANALTTARDQTIDQAVKDGQITQQQADWMKQRQQWAEQNGFGPGMMGGGHGGGRFGGPWGTPWQTAPAASANQ